MRCQIHGTTISLGEVGTPCKEKKNEEIDIKRVADRMIIIFFRVRNVILPDCGYWLFPAS
jgi:hypothetical protein